MLREGHPLAAEPVLTLDAYCAAEHVRVSFAGRPRGFVDEALAALGRSRRVVLTVNQFATAARVVHESDLLCVLPRSFVPASGLADGLALRTPPFSLPRIDVGMLWHRRQEHDAGARWLRATVGEVVRGLACVQRGRHDDLEGTRSGQRSGLNRPSATRIAAGDEEAPMDWFDGFPGGLHRAGEIDLFARTGGKPDGPPVLLLHGYPQTHAMWHRLASQLGADFRLVLADLRGYGDSARPVPAATPELEHAQYSKRAMAADMVALMRSSATSASPSSGTIAAPASRTGSRSTTRSASSGSRCSTSCRRSTCTSAPTCARRASTTTGSS